MNKWLKCLCQVCGLKGTEEGVDAYCRETVEQHEIEVEEMNHRLPAHLGSTESSPTLSSSSPYIPISECITGNPILSHDSSSAGHETGYCNTTFFPFPPRVNWATHPSKPESDTTPSPSQVGPIAPPRPPKKKLSPTFAGGNPVTPIAISSCTSTESMSMRSLPTPSSRTVFRYDKFQESEADLMGTYLQIDSNIGKSSAAAGPGDVKLHINSKGSMRREPGGLQLLHENSSSVEYRMIDHVKTKALNQMIQEREEQLSRPTNPTSKSQNN